MTVSTTTTTITYSGNASTTVFTFPFIGAAAADISVVYVDSNGTSTTLSPSLYTLTFNPVATGAIWAVGGSVTYPLVGSPIAVGTTLTISRTVPNTQTISIANQSNFYPQAVEQALDLLCMEIQGNSTSAQYALKTPTSDGTPPNTLPTKTARANGYLAFDSNGQPIVTTGTSSTNPSSTAPARKISTTGTATINILTSDSYGGVSIYQSSTPVTTLQLPTSGGPYPIFDGSGNAATYNITVLPPAGKTIDGNSSYVLNSNYQAVTVYWDGTQYLIAAGSQGLGSSISVAGSITAGTTLAAGTTVTAGTGITATTGNIVASTGNITSTAGTVADSKGEIRLVPLNSQSAPYTIATTDHGKQVQAAAGCTSLTFNTGSLIIGQNLVIINRNGGNLTLTQGASATLFNGTLGSGSRTLASGQFATVLCYDTNSYYINGTGLT